MPGIAAGCLPDSGSGAGAGSGAGSGRGAQVADRPGVLPVSRYVSTWRLTQSFGPPHNPWVPAFRSVTSEEPGSRCHSSFAPAYGVAASRSAESSSTGGSATRPVRGPTASKCPTSRGRPGFSGQKAHGRFIATLSQVSKGARRARAVLSRFQVAQVRGQGASLHSTAV